MIIPLKSSNGYSTMPVECSLMTKRIIFIESSITQETALEACKALLFLGSENKKLPVHMVINSPGGAIDAGLMILDAMKSSGLEIYTWCLSKAFSMAAVLFSAGSERYMLKHAELMLHQPLVSASNIEGNISVIKAMSESLVSTSRSINEILSEHTGKTIEQIEEDTRNDRYFTADEAIAYGLADKIADFGQLIRKDER